MKVILDGLAEGLLQSAMDGADLEREEYDRLLAVLDKETLSPQDCRDLLEVWKVGYSDSEDREVALLNLLQAAVDYWRATVKHCRNSISETAKDVINGKA